MMVLIELTPPFSQALVPVYYNFTHGVNSGTICGMASVDNIVASMKDSAGNVKFSDACKVATHYFGVPRQDGTSHKVYKMPWKGDPRINLQAIKGKAKPYQIKQLLQALEKLNGMKK